MIDNKLILESEKVLLRPMIYDDLESFQVLTSGKELWIYFTSDLSDKAGLEKWVKDAIDQTSSGARLAFTVIDKSDYSIAGSTSFGNISYYDKRLEIGWTWLGRKYQGKGINDDMKYLMLKYSFETLGFERVEFKTDVLNLPARKALKRTGCTEEGILRSHTLMTNNRRRDTIYYSILKNEWKSVPH